MTNLKKGDRVRVLHIEEMLELNAEEITDRFGSYIQFYDEDGDAIHDAMFPTDEGLYQELEGKIFTVKDIKRGGQVDLLEDKYIGWAVTTEMVRKVSEII